MTDYTAQTLQIQREGRQNMKTLFEELTEAGIETDRHESDLHFPVTEESMAILKRHPVQAEYATEFAVGDPATWIKAWMNVPFAYDPFGVDKPRG